MDYIESEFRISPADPGREILAALLAEEGYEAFEDTPEGIRGYIPANLFNIDKIRQVIRLISGEYTLEWKDKTIGAQNWNVLWEKEFEPVTLKRKLRIRAPFHTADPSLPLEIVIEPKMSFGTGHHQTTASMAEMMMEHDLKDKKVLDLGCGTGILAILAEKYGASEILAIDNDEWACNNALENISRNNCHKISVHQGDIRFFDNKHDKFDIILANINRNVLLGYMPFFGMGLRKKGILMISGFYLDDRKILNEAALEYGLKQVIEKNADNWAAISYKKN